MFSAFTWTPSFDNIYLIKQYYPENQCFVLGLEIMTP